MYIVICGGGKLGSILAQRLREDKHQVCIIDRSESVCGELSRDLENIYVICGNGTSPSILKEAKMDRADVCVGTTAADEDNIIFCRLGKCMFGVKRTVARVSNPKHLPLYKQMGVDIPVDSTSIIAQIVEEEASFFDVIKLFAVQKGRLSIMRLDIPETSPVINKELKDIKLPKNSVLASILRGSDIIIPSGNTRINAADEVLAVTLIESEKSVIEALMGKV